MSEKVATTKEALEPIWCANCGNQVYQSDNKWYHLSTAGMPCNVAAQAIPSRVSAPIVAPVVDQSWFDLALRYLRGDPALTDVPYSDNSVFADFLRFWDAQTPHFRSVIGSVFRAAPEFAAPASTVAPQEQPKARYEKAHETRYQMTHTVHPDIVVLWFLALKSHWFDDPANMFYGQREQAKAYLYKWVETGELADDNTTLEIATAMKFREWLASSWTAPASPAALRDEAEVYVDYERDPVTGEVFTVNRPYTPPSTLAKAAAEEIAKERARQITVEGWTPEHDDEHEDGELAQAANCYRLIGNGSLGEFSPDADQSDAQVPTAWPWDDKWWKPKTRLRNMVRAGALYQAEIERLNRARDAVTEEAQRLIDKTT